ncbi:MAG: restriction endonuclease subunit S [Anaerolineales bacterium]|nr:restriction endonuclease subunit S [Anaerolineales bacterium]
MKRNSRTICSKVSVFTGTKVNILIQELLKSKGLVLYCFKFKTHKSKYSYSFTINSTRLKRQKILLPTNNKGKPDYLFMENYIKNLEYEKLKLYLGYKKTKSR